ncbi:MAG: PotD/PotF family extracellular solute-binding protein, partial [Gammaproteobacteria bacterium]|nr:PotD/PotF family extracellular solute-binding protein [Gammaproteobacteria bacterium]
RDFLKKMAVSGLAVGTGAASTMWSGSAQAARELRMLTWDGYVDPRVIDTFTERHGIQVSYELHTSDPDSVNKLRAGQTEIWDIINLNNPWAREMMWPEDLIVELPRDRFEPYFDKMLPMFKSPYHWAMSLDGEHLLGVCQRIDTFDFIVNTDKISADMGKDQGWDLFHDPAMKGRYGILAYDNWNIMHMCMGAGLHPFKDKSDDDVAKFEETARNWINGAKIISDDFTQLNLGLLNDEIDAYFSGGTYSISAARFEGENQLYHVAPKSGPADGKGAILWIELNSAVNNPDFHPAAFDWLEYILQPDVSYFVGTAGGFFLPVGQLADPEVLAKFSKEELDSFQWDEFDYRASSAVEYDVVPDYNRLYDIYTAALRDKT